MHDYNARYYSAVLGRFVSPDSIVPEPGSSQGWNRYAYVNSNPLNFIDPTGYCREEDENYNECMEFADQIVSEIGSDETWNSVSIYDLNWENEEQIEKFISAHNELPKQLEELQAWMDYTTNELGPHPEDFWRRWEAIAYNEEQIGNFAYAFYHKAFEGVIEAAPIEGAWKEPATQVVTWVAETLTVELITEPAEFVARGEMLTAVAVAEAVNVTAQIAVMNQAIMARGRYTLSQPTHSTVGQCCKN